MAEYIMPHIYTEPFEKRNPHDWPKKLPEKKSTSLVPENYEAWSIGLEHFLRLLGSNSGNRNTSYPPYNIARLDSDHFVVELAIAGFSKDDITITKEQNLLKVTGNREANTDGIYIHKGIAGRTFNKEFVLADHIIVTSAEMVDGVLTIKLERQLPEEKKPQVIEIK